MLEIKNLEAKVVDSEDLILKGINLSVKAGEIHAIMGLSLIHISEPTRPY